MQGKEVFISYTRSHYDEAKTLKEQLKNYHGIDAFLDQKNIHSGEIWTEALSEAIIDCKVCVLMLNKDSNVSRHVAREISLAYAEQKEIIVIRTDECDISKKLKYAIGTIQATPAIPPDNKNLLNAAQEIAKALKRVNQNLAYAQSSNIKQKQPSKETPPSSGVGLFALIILFFFFWGISSMDYSWKAFPSYKFDDEETGTVFLEYTGDMQDFSKENPPPWYSDKEKIISVIIPETATSIGNSAFEDCQNLETVTIYGEITSIGDKAFTGCTKLESIYSGNTETETLDFDIQIPESVTTIGHGAFSGCSSFKSVYIPDSVVEIHRDAFKSCNNLETVKISKNVTFIGASTFEGCKSLRTVNIPPLVTSIQDSLFATCTSLPTIKLPENLKEIGASAFQGSALNEIIIPSSVTKIGERAFKTCEKLPKIDIPNSVTKIGDEAFMECSSLSEISLPQTFLQNIGANAFPYNNALFTFTPINSEAETHPEVETSSELVA